MIYMKKYFKWIPAFAGMTRKKLPAFAGMTILVLFSTWLMFHTFDYDSAQKNILIARTIWSDFGSHIPLIRSFSMGDNFDRMMKFQSPEYPLFSGEPIRYHFLFYMVVGLLEKTGLRLDWALNIPSILGFTLLLWGIWTLAMALFKDKKVAFLSILFFLFNGSLAFLKFFKEHPLSLDTPLDIMRANTFPAFGPWDGGPITAFWNLNIYTNQRHLAWGFAIGIWFLVWVFRNQNNHWKKIFPAAVLWGVTIGILLYFHQPMLVVMAILISSYFLVFPHLRLPLVISAMIGLLFIVPQLLIVPKTNAFAWHPGYLLNAIPHPATFLSFWFQNIGLHALLIPFGFFMIPKNARRILFPLFILFAIGNLFQFSIEMAANHKFFNFALILGNMISAYIVINLSSVTLAHAGVQRKIKLFAHWIPARFDSARRAFAGMTTKIGRICIFVGLVGLLTLSGLIDFFVVFNDQKGTLADVGSPRFAGEAGNNQTATWIAVNTPNDAIFLNSSFLYHPASLAGRKIFMGWPYFPWSAGYDTYKRNDEMRTIYESHDPDIFCPLLKKHHISFVTVQDSKNDPNLPTIDTDYFRDSFQPVFEDPTTRQWIYSSSTLCPENRRPSQEN